MGKITKTMQPKHRETLSPWLKDYVQAAASTPLPLLPKKLQEFPSRWPFPRGDLYHWILLLNRFDSILESFCETYSLHVGFQTRDFACEVLLNNGAPVDYCDDKPWSMPQLTELGYGPGGDGELVASILKFTTMLLERCGNRSIYGSSSHLNSLLNSTDLKVVLEALRVGLELAQRYQASVKRLAQPIHKFSASLLANHYNIDLERVHCMAQSFAKTPIIRLSDPAPATPASADKGKEKERVHDGGQKNVASMFANDLVALAAPGEATDTRWNGWGDIKLPYYPKPEPATASLPEEPAVDRGSTSIPTTPTPLRRSSTGIGQTPRSHRVLTGDDSPTHRTPGTNSESHMAHGPKFFEIRQSEVQSKSIYELLKQLPPGMPSDSRYEALHRLRVCKALLGSTEDRQLALSVRLMAITNLAYIHQESTFIEKALRQDNDEPRRYQLVYQLAELIHPSVDGAKETPRWLQSIAIALLEAIMNFQSKHQDVVSALNANVSHGVLLYVVRKAIDEMKEDLTDDIEGQSSENDQWRDRLFQLTFLIAGNTRQGVDIAGAGLIDLMLEILNLRSKVAVRTYPSVLTFFDTMIYNHQAVFNLLTTAHGLDTIANLIIRTVTASKELTAAGRGTKPQFHASLVDYDIPFYEQQTLKWLLKFLHHVMVGGFNNWGGSDRLLRNLVDNSALLGSFRAIIKDMRLFGSVVWTNAATILSDLINNDPTSFAAIAESGMIQTFLEALTGRPVVMEHTPATPRPDAHNSEGPASPSYSEDSVTLEKDERPHPPTQQMLDTPREWLPAHGILPSAEAINIIPNVLNSISLNNLGMKAVVSSRAFESYLEIFESPDHVHCMGDEQLAVGVGTSFDELARHHPALRPALSNAVIDMVARVVHLAKTKATTDGWGAKLQVIDLDGHAVTADRSLLDKSASAMTSIKGKEKASGDSDVDMTDVNASSSGVVDTTIPRIGPPADAGTTAPYKEITPYILALSYFLGPIASTSSLKTSFVRDGGIELLLDLTEAPSIPDNFAHSSTANALANVTGRLIEAHAAVGQFSLLNRILNNMTALQPLLRSEESTSFFGPFVMPELSLRDSEGSWDQAAVRRVADGTTVVRALVNLRTLLNTLHDSLPYSSRTSLQSLPQVNIYDYLARLIKALGPLLRRVMFEQMSMPEHAPKLGTNVSPTSADPAADGNVLPVDASVPAGPVTIGGPGNPDSPAPRSNLEEERATVQHRNFNILRGLLESVNRSVSSFFQVIGKTLMNRRPAADSPYLKSNQLGLAEALAEAIEQQLFQLSETEQSDANSLKCAVVSVLMVHEMLIVPGRTAERHDTLTPVTPVLLAFKERGGLLALNQLLRRFVDVFLNSNTAGDNKPTSADPASTGINRILEFYTHVVSGKLIADTLTQSGLLDKVSPGPLVVELRMAILPVVRELWENESFIEKAEHEPRSKIITILKTVCAAEHETDTHRKPDRSSRQPLFEGRKVEKFPWNSYRELLSSMALESRDDIGLVREAVYRALGRHDAAAQYYRAHEKGIAGQRNPVPEEDAYHEPPAQNSGEPAVQPALPPQGDVPLDPMSVDPLPAADNAVAAGEAGDGSSDESHDGHDTSSQRSTSEESNTPAKTTSPSDRQTSQQEAISAVTKELLDVERTALQRDLLDRCLDVVRCHPDSVFNISELIKDTILKTKDRPKEVGETLANALMSFAVDDYEDRKANGKSIAAYAHLLSLLVKQSPPLFAESKPVLKDNLGDYLLFLEPSAGPNDELPQWMPHVLLIFELLLADDAKPPEWDWQAPKTEDEVIKKPTLVARDPNLTEEQRGSLLAKILEILPRIGKEDTLALSVLRILVILTRDHATAKIVGEKRNLQRLFVMAKQLCTGGSARIKNSRISDNIMLILRHIIEDEQTIRQIMEAEIRQRMSQPGRSFRASPGFDVDGYLRSFSHFALRSPKIFAEVTVDILRLSRCPQQDRDRSHRFPPGLFLPVDEATPPKDSSIEPAVQGTEDLTISDVKPSTETDKEMVDINKTPAQEVKRPVIENPDGVIHFLLCELLNYKEVDDKEPSTAVAKDGAQPGGSATASGDAASSSGEELGPEAKDKDKKSPRSVFKAEDHPIFVYRCFLLNCLAELLKSFTRAKVEFINFKRSAPIQTNTPIKPRSSVLNYLLNDLLSLSHTASNLDSIALKKKAAISSHAQAVFVSLVSYTRETLFDWHRDDWSYDDEPDLLFVRRFVLDTVLRAYKEASVPGEPFDVRYARMICLAELMSQMIGEKDREPIDRSRDPALDKADIKAHRQIRRLMYEKGYLAALTASIADIDLTFPNVKRTIKYILRVLRSLTKTAFQLSHSDVMPITSADQIEDDIASSSSLSDVDSGREETPDLYRNSALGLLEPRDGDDFSGDSEEDDDDMYDDDQYDEELDYGEEMSQDGEDNPSDDDEELGEMGPIEGLSGEPGVVEVIMGENEDDDEDMDDDEDDEPSDEDDEDELDSDDMEELEEQIEVLDEEGNPIEDDGASGWESGTDDEDEEDHDEFDYEADVQDHHEAHMHEFHEVRTMSPFPAPDVQEELRILAGGGYGDEDDYPEDGADEDDEEEEDDVDDDVYFYDPDHHHDELPHGNFGWDIAIEPQTRVRVGGTRNAWPSQPFLIGETSRDPLGGDFRSFMRSTGQPRSSANGIDDGANPLLVPSSNAERGISHREPGPQLIHVTDLFRTPAHPGDPSWALISELVRGFPAIAGRSGQHLSLRYNGSVRHFSVPILPPQASRESRPESRSTVYQEPSQAVAFSPQSTAVRFQEEAAMIFGSTHDSAVSRLTPFIKGSLAPAAREAEKEVKAREEEEKKKREEDLKRRAEEERKAREAKEAEEKAAREKKAAEERERAERERAEAEARAAVQAETAAEAGESGDAQAMEGIEAEPQPEAPRVRVTATLGGETVDITDLGIDPDYLDALPDELREEVIAQAISARRSEARQQAAAVGENTEVFQEFLEALPDELRQEILNQERQEQRSRRAANDGHGLLGGPAGQPVEMDLASILASFPPELRAEALLNQGADLMDQLPPDLAAEARRLDRRHNINQQRPPQAVPGAVDIIPPQASGANDLKAQRRSIVQMLDKAGVATLLRLMFVTQQGSIRTYLFEVFRHVCENRQNRLEVVSTLLQILQDGSTDMDAVERSFSQLSLKARQPKDKDPKTPTSLKRTSTNVSAHNQITTNSDVSPLLVVQQCLDLLVELATKNMHVPSLFLTEHETVASTLKRSLSRKGKAKDVNSKAQKYAINSLLSLLDRSLIMESSDVMQYLADLLNKVTYPLQAIERRRKEAEEEAKKKEAERSETMAQSTAAATEEQTAAPSAEGEAAEKQPAGETSGAAEAVAAESNEQPSAESSTAKGTKPEEEKKTKTLMPPVIPDHNLRLVVSIFVARECSSKTFQNTISTIKNLSNIPGAKNVFGQELVRQARELSENIVSDLNDLLPHILKAESGTEIQGVALAKFSPGASEQNKLLRVLTVLDHLFDSKNKKADSSGEDWLGSLYWNPTFGTMWEKLSACLGAIQKRENMLNVATILLPLIESLMVVCKDTTLNDAPQSQTATSKEMLLSSPPPEDRIAGLFFSFTEEHRKILNELVRQNPKLMSGTFALLVKNPKVLDFDNKRNYFTRSVHKTGNQRREERHSLQLHVRRDHVFHDSFKSLYYKTPNEIKFGKLNIRFHGEEGVDAGGVTREWFQVLTRQMFNPDYALFIPVSSDRTTFHPNKLSGVNDEHLRFFQFIGRIIGKALYEGRLLDCYFSRAVYKRILGKPVSVKDMESFDPDYYKSLVWMLENDITDIITETFSTEDDVFGATEVVDLIENGRNIPVTEENKQEYVRLIVEHKLLGSVKEQMKTFLGGFHDVIPADLIAIFNEQELELLISGLPDIDVDDWKGNTEYHNYTAASQQIQWFWRAVRSFDKEERAKLLQFVTGTSKVPLNGFKELEGMNGVSRFNIHRDYGNKERLPSSHTCFNQLDLPEYESYDILRSQVLKAITQGSDYFGFA